MTRLKFVGLTVCLGLTATLAHAYGDPPTEPDRERVESEAMGQAARADRLFKAGDYAGALPLYEAERASRAALDDLRYEAYALRAIGCCRANLGDDEAAIIAWHDARKRDARREDTGFEGYDWLLIGRAHLRSQRAAEAAKALEQALPKLSKAVDRDHEADARLALAEALFSLDRLADVASHLERAELLARELKDQALLGSAWLAMGRLSLTEGNPGLAAERASDARGAFGSPGTKPQSAAALRLLGESLADLENLGAAASALEMASTEHEVLGDNPALAEDLGLLAAVLADDGKPALAAQVARRAAEANRAADDPDGEIETLVARANYLSQAGDRAASATTLESAVEIGRRESPVPRFVRLLVLAADVSRTAGHVKRAEELLDEADRAASRADNAALRRIVSEARTATKTVP